MTMTMVMARQALVPLLHPSVNHVNTLVFNTLNSTAASLPHLLQAHAHILKTGECNETELANKLLSRYATHHCFADATRVLDSIPQPDDFSFSSLICALSKSNHSHWVLFLLSRMLSSGHAPDYHVLPSAIKACAALLDKMRGREVHGVASTSGHASDFIVQSSLVHMYLKFEEFEDAHKVFDKITHRDVITWSALVAAYARNGLVEKAKELFNEMEMSGVEPNLVSWNGMISGFKHCGFYSEAVTLMRKMHLQGGKPDGTTVSSVLSAVGNLEDLTRGVQVHGYLIKEGIAADICIISALIDMYGRCSSPSDMSRVFNEMEHIDLAAYSAFVAGFSRNGLVDDALRAFARFRGQNVDLNVKTWTSIIACCSQNGKDMVALDLFRDMQAAGVKANAVTVASLLPACGNIAALVHGKAAHSFCLRMGMTADVYAGSALIDMYSNCGKMDAARLCFDRMPVKNLVCWNAVMNGYAMHGNAKEAMAVFHLMQRNGQKPDSISFTCILSACNHKGLTEKGWYYFNSMSEEHGIEARMEHYACMVNLLSRAGKLYEAHSLIKKMPLEPDSCVWGSLLSSCRVYKNVTLGEAAAKKLFVLEPDNPGNYILLSNIYACKGMWKEVANVRAKMKKTGLRKNPGCSWIELKKEVHVILAGDDTHPQMTHITVKLQELSMEMVKLGCFPVSDFALQDVEEQDKEQLLCGHSEKLAVVLGLLNTCPGSALRVTKNLRICGDCHVFMKFVSSFENREISVRDTARFHHFKDGACSCGDYW